MIPDWAVLVPLILATLVFMAFVFHWIFAKRVYWPFLYFSVLLCIVHAQIRTQQMVQKFNRDWIELEILKLKERGK